MLVHLQIAVRMVGPAAGDDYARFESILLGVGVRTRHTHTTVLLSLNFSKMSHFRTYERSFEVGCN
jgi:hypothetical protein